MNDDEKQGNVVSLGDARAAREQAMGEEAWEAGECFKFAILSAEDFDIGHTPDGEVVFGDTHSMREQSTGYQLDPDEAEKLGIALIQSADRARAEVTEKESDR
jgi:hypothetical protein